MDKKASLKTNGKFNFLIETYIIKFLQSWDGKNDFVFHINKVFLVCKIETATRRITEFWDVRNILVCNCFSVFRV